nr:hypothetical protein [Tanacetum cinerariifolium]
MKIPQGFSAKDETKKVSTKVYCEWWGCSTTVGGTAYMNVNVPERDTFSENPSGPQQRSTRDVGTFSQDLGGLKRRHLRRVEIAGPS